MGWYTGIEGEDGEESRRAERMSFPELTLPITAVRYEDRDGFSDRKTKVKKRGRKDIRVPSP